MASNNSNPKTTKILRWVILFSVATLSFFTFLNLEYVQNTLESSSALESSLFNTVTGTFNHLDNVPSSGGSVPSSAELPCLVHEPLKINASENRVSDPSKTLLEQNTSKCGTLRRQWLYNPPLSRFARMIENHQTNCSMPLATHHFDNTFGLGR